MTAREAQQAKALATHGHVCGPWNAEAIGRLDSVIGRLKRRIATRHDVAHELEAIARWLREDSSAMAGAMVDVDVRQVPAEDGVARDA